MPGGPTRTPTATALLVAGTLGLAACGGVDQATETGAAFPTGATGAPAAGPKVEAGTPGATVTTYLAAFSTGDGDAVCKLYTASQRKRIATAFKGTCADGIERAFVQGGAEDGFKESLGNVRVGRTEIEDDTAIVRLVAVRGNTSADALAMQLKRQGGKWLISEPGSTGGG